MGIWLLTAWLSFTMETVAKPFIVTQWPRVAEVMAGDDVILHCNIVELYSPCSTVVWLRVDPEKAAISLTDRVQIHPNHPSSVCTALIANSTVHDSGIYYCTAVHGRFAHIGNGSRVVVKEHISFPLIDILSPLIQNSPFVPLQCVVTGVEGFQEYVSWAIEGRKEKGQSVWTHRHNDAVQITRNQILITDEEWERNVQCVCKVNFMGQNYTKTLKRHDALNGCRAIKYTYVSLCIIFGLLTLITLIAYKRRKQTIQ
nr:uncharacterized protein LOC129454437 isoform X1 [Misgurnus anguillicaudatus]XP_055074939.1 uncharacterized protein LOC129454437 isoform X1 [Misgurnus anguillicaudatus]XP_055074940.1 uncharacterized protein LOC129454437 isoform X1 [Misgurnus anguillicaudatus]